MRSLVISNENIQTHLKSVYKELIELDVHPEWPSEKLYSKYEELKKGLTSKGDFEVTIYYMTDDEAFKLAEKIINMYDHIAKIEYPKVFPPE